MQFLGVDELQKLLIIYIYASLKQFSKYGVDCDPYLRPVPLRL